jgi:hypothetical protein
MLGLIYPQRAREAVEEAAKRDAQRQSISKFWMKS